MPSTNVDVVIVGGGPFGLMLANELGRRGIGVVLVDQKPGTTQNAAANATQARTMEHFRRLGFADEVRALGLAARLPNRRRLLHALRAPRARALLAAPSHGRRGKRSTRFRARGARRSCRTACNQKFIEPVLRRHAEALETAYINYGWRMTSFSDLARRWWPKSRMRRAGTSHRKWTLSCRR